MSRLLIDSCVLIDIIKDDPNWSDWSIEILEGYYETNDLIINPIIYTEISIDFREQQLLDEWLSETNLHIEEIPKKALFKAGKVFVEYRKRGGGKSTTMPDFYIGAHAQNEEIPLVTRDKRRFETYFPNIQLITP